MLTSIIIYIFVSSKYNRSIINLNFISLMQTLNIIIASIFISVAVGISVFGVYSNWIDAVKKRKLKRTRILTSVLLNK